MPEAPPSDASRTPTADDAVQVVCPDCGTGLSLNAAHFGIEGHCPSCKIPIVAERGANGTPEIRRLDQPASVAPASPPPAEPAANSPPPPPASPPTTPPTEPSDPATTPPAVEGDAAPPSSTPQIVGPGMPGKHGDSTSWSSHVRTKSGIRLENDTASKKRTTFRIVALIVLALGILGLIHQYAILPRRDPAPGMTQVPPTPSPAIPSPPKAEPSPPPEPAASTPPVPPALPDEVVPPPEASEPEASPDSPQNGPENLATAPSPPDPPKIVPTPIPAPVPTPAETGESSPGTPSSPESATAPASPAEPTPLTPEEIEEIAAKSQTAEINLIKFLVAPRSWEKLLHILSPEDNLLSILEFGKLNKPEAGTAFEHVRTEFVDSEQRWVSFFDLTEPEDVPRTACFLHLEDGSAKMDFSLYWQNRSDRLNELLADKIPIRKTALRVHFRQLAPEEVTMEPNPDLFLETPTVFELSLPFTEFSPVQIPVAQSSDVLADLKVGAPLERKEPVAAILELAWKPAEADPAKDSATIAKVIQWGLWAGEEP